MATRLTAKQKNQLNSMNASSSRAGGLGTIIEEMRYGGSVAPVSGTLVPATILHYQIAPAIGAATAVHAAVTLTTAVQTVTTAITSPDYARCLSLVSNASITTDVTINGADIDGTTLTETIALNGTSAVTTLNAFKTVTSIVYPIRTNVGDTVSVGTGNVYGMPQVIANVPALIAKSFDGAADNGTLVVDAAIAKNLYSIAGTANGTKKLDLYYLA